MKYRQIRGYSNHFFLSQLFSSHSQSSRARPKAVVQVGNSSPAPVPLIEKGHAVDWWFVFKFNSAAFPGCRGTATRQCPYGGEVKNYKVFGQQYVFASSESPSLKQGSDCAGDTTAEPIGATFDEIYNSAFHYVILERPVLRRSPHQRMHQRMWCAVGTFKRRRCMEWCGRRASDTGFDPIMASGRECELSTQDRREYFGLCEG